MKRDINLRGSSRRDFVKAVVATGAALGVGPTRVLEVLDKMGGSALADEAYKVKRVVNIVAGTGGFAWFTLLWPVPTMIKTFQSAFAYDDINKCKEVLGQSAEGRQLYSRVVPATGKPLWERFGAKKQVTTFMCGRSNAHEVSPRVANNTNSIPDGVGGAVQLYAGQAAIQTTLKALVPVIGQKFQNQDMPYGRAPGAPNPNSVADAKAMVGLFSSAASTSIARLANVKNQSAFQDYYSAFLALQKTSARPTFQRAYEDSKVAVGLLAKNLATQLNPAAGQVATWCGSPQAAANEKIAALAESLIVASNAFKLGLTAQINVPCFNDDPHGAFAGQPGVVADGIASVLHFFMEDLDTAKDPFYANLKLSDTVTLTCSGDTPKDPYVASGWPDGTPNGSNWIYVMSQGLCKPGWFGDVQRNSKVNYNPATGQLAAGTPDNLVLDGALAAILFATSGGDDRRVRDFYTGDYAGLVNLQVVN